MKPTVWLRIASVVTLVHSALHTIGGVFGKMPAGPAGVAVAAMQANHFRFMGSMRTMWDFHLGMGLAVTIFLTVEGIVFWQFGSLIKREGAALRPVLAVFAAGYIAFAAVSLLYFFTLPSIFELLIAALLVMAMASARREAAAAS